MPGGSWSRPVTTSKQPSTAAPDGASAVSALRFAAGMAFAEMRGEAAFSLLQTGSAPRVWRLAT